MSRSSSTFPRYSYPPGMLYSLLRDALLGRRRNFPEDARACIACLQPALRVLGPQLIPRDGCFAITLNHYSRPGFAAQWSALAISASVPSPVHWIMTEEFTYPESWLAPLARPTSRLVLRRIASVYGFTGMPPMPPRPRDVAARAASVRAVLRRVRRAPDAVIAFAPEGADQPGGQLSMPPPGSGRFCLLLAGAGLQFLPVGIYESDGALVLNFGQPYTLTFPTTTSVADRDRTAAFTVMSHIAPLLPVELRGHFTR